MGVNFAPEQEAQLPQIASHDGTETERLAKDAALRLLEQDARFRAAAKTQSPSTPLRSGRDDRVIGGRHRAGRRGGIEEKGERSIRRDAAPEKMLWSAVLTWL